MYIILHAIVYIHYILINYPQCSETKKKKPRERPKTTYLHVIKTQLKEKHFQTLEDAMMEAKDRERWQAVVQDPSVLAYKGQQ